MTARPVLTPFAPGELAVEHRPGVDLRPSIDRLGLKILNQGGRGTCSVFAMTFLLDYMHGRYCGERNPHFSEEYLNAAGNQAVGSYNDGGFFSDLDKGYQTFGEVHEQQLPYKASFDPKFRLSRTLLTAGEALAPRLKCHFIKPWNVQTGVSDEQMAAVQQELSAGRPVAAGLRWPKAFAIETVHGVPLMKTPPADKVFDGHSIALVGFRASAAFPGGGYFVFRNSWGTGFGDNGYGYMSFEYVKKYANDLVFYAKN